jgi:hypothetical protein
MKTQRKKIVYSVTGVLASIVIGIIAWVISSDPMSSLVVSLLGVLLVLHLESRYQSEMHAQHIFRILQLRISLSKETDFTSKMIKLSSSYLTLKESSHEIFIKKAEQHLSETIELFQDLSKGHMSIDANEVVLVAIHLIDNLKRSIFATSMVKLEDFWFRGFGEKYIEKHKQAIKRGVNITRIFIVEDFSVFEDMRLRKLINDQINMSIDVRILWNSQTPPEYLLDFGIWDDEIVFYIKFDLNFQMSGADVYTDIRNIQKAHKIRDFMLNEAQQASSVLKEFKEGVS